MAAHIERGHALGRAKLVPDDGQHANAELLNVDGHLPNMATIDWAASGYGEIEILGDVGTFPIDWAASVCTAMPGRTARTAATISLIGCTEPTCQGDTISLRRCDLGDRLHRAHLVVRVHHRHEHRARPHRRRHLRRRDAPLAVHFDETDAQPACDARRERA